MTSYKPNLSITRLAIFKEGADVYNEEFHEGINIIRGKNGSGKSTISDFLFYALGGDLSKWKNEAKTCDFTLLEVSINGQEFTLKREVKERSRKGMDIFQGPYEEAIESTISGWLRYPYNATEQKESYYQAILKELGIPYSRSSDNTSITMHQLLRLMYVDQMTSLDRLFKFDRFDSPNKRKAIGELMMGLSDFTLYEKRVKAQKIESKLDSKIREIKILHQFFGNDIITTNQIDEKISELRSEIDVLEKELLEPGGEELDGQKEVASLRTDIAKLRSELNDLLERKSACSFDISDSQKFVASLASRLIAINESSNVIHALSDIGFHYCPSCFNTVKEKSVGCRLCGIDLDEGAEDRNPTFKIRKEIEFQIRESNLLIEKRQDRLAEIDLRVNQKQVEIESKLRELASIERPMKDVSAAKRKIIRNYSA